MNRINTKNPNINNSRCRILSNPRHQVTDCPVELKQYSKPNVSVDNDNETSHPICLSLQLKEDKHSKQDNTSKALPIRSKNVDLKLKDEPPAYIDKNIDVSNNTDNIYHSNCSVVEDGSHEKIPQIRVDDTGVCDHASVGHAEVCPTKGTNSSVIDHVIHHSTKDETQSNMHENDTDVSRAECSMHDKEVIRASTDIEIDNVSKACPLSMKAINLIRIAKPLNEKEKECEETDLETVKTLDVGPLDKQSQDISGSEFYDSKIGMDSDYSHTTWSSNRTNIAVPASKDNPSVKKTDTKCNASPNNGNAMGQLSNLVGFRKSLTSDKHRSKDKDKIDKLQSSVENDNRMSFEASNKQTVQKLLHTSKDDRCSKYPVSISLVKNSLGKQAVARVGEKSAHRKYHNNLDVKETKEEVIKKVESTSTPKNKSFTHTRNRHVEVNSQLPSKEKSNSMEKMLKPMNIPPVRKPTSLQTQMGNISTKQSSISIENSGLKDLLFSDSPTCEIGRPMERLMSKEVVGVRKPLYRDTLEGDNISSVDKTNQNYCLKVNNNIHTQCRDIKTKNQTPPKNRNSYPFPSMFKDGEIVQHNCNVVEDITSDVYKKIYNTPIELKRSFQQYPRRNSSLSANRRCRKKNMILKRALQITGRKDDNANNESDNNDQCHNAKSKNKYQNKETERITCKPKTISGDQENSDKTFTTFGNLQSVCAREPVETRPTSDEILNLIKTNADISRCTKSTTSLETLKIGQGQILLPEDIGLHPPPQSVRYQWPCRGREEIPRLRRRQQDVVNKWSLHLDSVDLDHSWPHAPGYRDDMAVHKLGTSRQLQEAHAERRRHARRDSYRGAGSSTILHCVKTV